MGWAAQGIWMRRCPSIKTPLGQRLVFAWHAWVMEAGLWIHLLTESVAEAKSFSPRLRLWCPGYLFLFVSRNRTIRYTTRHSCFSVIPLHYYVRFVPYKYIMQPSFILKCTASAVLVTRGCCRTPSYHHVICQTSLFACECKHCQYITMWVMCILCIVYSCTHHGLHEWQYGTLHTP